MEKMKIAMFYPSATTNNYGGQKVQGRMWKEGLEKLGHRVDLINPFEIYDWESYDFFIILGLGTLLYDYVQLLRRFAKSKIVSAPIIDWPGSVTSFKLSSMFRGSVRLHIHRPFHDYYKCRNSFSLFLVRSEHEKRFLTEGYGIDESRVQIVPISLRFNKEDLQPIDLQAKEPFCLHVSRLASYEKNVGRLIEAAKKYRFELILAGTLNGKNEQDWLNNQIGDAGNIHYVGRLSDESLNEYYRRAKVFALPSLIEGVGMVALEAAVQGAEIVLTNLGAPKEYYDGRAYLVNPLDVNDIGSSVRKALYEQKSQPELRDYIINKYSFEHCSMLLADVLSKEKNQK
jgi:glycosyltransferase involved in cell wall biosynthesis